MKGRKGCDYFVFFLLFYLQGSIDSRRYGGNDDDDDDDGEDYNIFRWLAVLEKNKIRDDD